MSTQSDTFPELAAVYEEAACKGMPIEIFFPSDDDSEELHDKTTFARDTCQGCPVQAECQAHALEHEEFGIWGGLTEKERKRINRKRSNR